MVTFLYHRHSPNRGHARQVAHLHGSRVTHALDPTVRFRCDLHQRTHAPKLIRLIFGGVLYHADARTARNALEYFFRDLLSWVTPTSESMRTFFVRKFPRCQRIEFHFCTGRNSEIHFRRGLRRRIERKLKNCLEESGAEVEWLEDDGNYEVWGLTFTVSCVGRNVR